VLRVHSKSWTDPSDDPRNSLPDSALTLAETCIQCSRHSCRLLSEAWICGSFAIFDYFYTQYLFSAATNLAISSLLGSAQSQSDSDSFKTAADIIRQLGQMGNFAAKEFLEHLDAIEDSMHKVRQNVSNASPAQQLVISDAAALPLSAPMMTAGMALAEPSLQDFLADTGLTISGIDNPTFDPLQMPYWPGIWGGDEWANG
jgi:proline utilization trans-activator